MARRRPAYEASSPWWAEPLRARIAACSQTHSSLSARSLRPPPAWTEPPLSSANERAARHAVPRLPVTLAHLEDTFDELAAAMRLLAEAAAEWCDTDDADEGTLPPEASALLWHLRSVADTLTDARDGCLTTRRWAQQLLERAAPEPEPGVIMNLPTAHRPSATSHRLRRRRLRAGPPRRERRAPSRRPAGRAAHARPRDRPPGAWLRWTGSPSASTRGSGDRQNSPSPSPRTRSTRCHPTSPRQPRARGATRRAGRGARPGRRRLRRRVDRGRVARPRGLALRRLGLRVQRRRAARAVPGDDRPGARGGVAARRPERRYVAL